MTDLNEKIKASIYLLSYFETLGFNNTQWEFNYGNTQINNPQNSSYIWLSIIHDFFSMGGFSNINLTNWDSSDDTIMSIATGLACINGGKEENYIEEYLKILEELKKSKRASGIGTLKYLELIKRIRSVTKLEQKETMGGNGAAMRTSTIGLVYYREKDVDLLIENSIIASRITHNYSLGYLGGLITALFTSYAIRNIPIWNWIDEMLTLYENGNIDNYMKKTNIYENYLKEKDNLFDKWYHYQEQRLSKFKYQSFDFRHYDNRIESLEYYNDYKGKNEEKNYFRFGSSGLSATILAYDSLLMSFSSNKIPFDLNNPKDIKISLQSVLFFSSLHFGDNDTTGAIAGAWYGAFYGFRQFDENKLNQLEFNKELKKLSNLIENVVSKK